MQLQNLGMAWDGLGMAWHVGMASNGLARHWNGVGWLGIVWDALGLLLHEQSVDLLGSSNSLGFHAFPGVTGHWRGGGAG
eukprot:gene11048-biopygen13899